MTRFNIVDFSDWVDSADPTGDQTTLRRIIDGAITLPLTDPFVAHVYLSPILDTGKNNSRIGSFTFGFESLNNSYVSFSFRANNSEFAQSDNSLDWSGFTSPNQIGNNQKVEPDDIGIFVSGRYLQIRALLFPTSSSPSLSSIELNTAVTETLLVPAATALDHGTILGQTVNFTGTKTIYKISLDLSVTRTDPKEVITGSNGTVSFPSTVFQSARDSWIFQPVIHWLSENGWITSGTTLQNALQTDSYSVSDDAVANAPYLNYEIYFPDAGVYELWGFGYTSGSGIFYSIDNDTTDLRRLQLGSQDSGWQGVPRWTNFGSFFFEEGSVHNFTVYLSEPQTAILDQWYFTQWDFATELSVLGQEGYSTPRALSKLPFMTAVRLRSLTSGTVEPLDELTDDSVSITMWKSSAEIFASGEFNYEIRNNSLSSGIDFSDGLSIEYWQIGGSSKHFAAWFFNEV